MRRRPDSPNGAMDLLLLHFIELFRADGCEGLNLGLAPLANVDEPGAIGAALRLMYERGNAAFNFRGLRSYKDKWKPVWVERYLVYRRDAVCCPRRWRWRESAKSKGGWRAWPAPSSSGHAAAKGRPERDCFGRLG